MSGGVPAGLQRGCSRAVQSRCSPVVPCRPELVLPAIIRPPEEQNVSLCLQCLWLCKTNYFLPVTYPVGMKLKFNLLENY